MQPPGAKIWPLCCQVLCQCSHLIWVYLVHAVTFHTATRLVLKLQLHFRQYLRALGLGFRSPGTAVVAGITSTTRSPPG